MFFSAEDDDQDFASAGKGSRLGNLFGIDKASSQGGNESLTYTAPKQPKPKEPAAGQAEGTPAVLFASAVNAYKYVDGKYESQGKLGAAILANHSTLDYRVLLYVSKQQQVSHAKINTAFIFTVQPNNYAILYDDNRLTWSLMFDSEQNVQQFAKNVALAKALSAGSALDTVVAQDMNVGEGTSVETGSSVEVKYTGWLLTNNTFGQEFDSNVKSDKMYRFQIGKSKVIKGWHTGVVGMKKGSKRLLVVPPSLAYGSKGVDNKIPANSTLIFEITIKRIKGDKSASPEPAPGSTASPGPDHEDHTVKERTKSISDQMSHASHHGKSGKARLISKMAKMGQPILPMMGGAVIANDEDESGEEEEEEEEEGSIEPQSPQPIAESPPQNQRPRKPKFTKPKPVYPHPHPHPHHAQPMVQPMTQQYVQQQQPVMAQSQPAFVQNLPGAQQLAVYQPQQPGFVQPQFQVPPQTSMGQFPPGQPPMYSSPYQQPPEPVPAQPTAKPPSDTTILPVLTENRQQTTELRINMGKVSDKVDRILEKVECLQNQQNGQLSLQTSQPNMEASVLMHNVQRVVQENDRLRKEGYEKSSKIEALNDKISELLQSNQQYVEKSQTILEQRNEGFLSTANQSQARVLALEQEKVQLTTELSNTTALYSNLQMEVTNLRKKEIEFQQKIGTSSNDTVRLQEELEALRTQKIDDSQKISELSTNFKEEKQRRKHLENKLTQIQEEFNDIKSANETLERNLNDRKKKAADEKRTREEEYEESKEQMEREIQTLREKLRKTKTSTDVATAEQVSQVEEELSREWKEKCDKLVANQQQKHKRALLEVRQENEDLQSTIKQLEKKIQDMKSSSGNTGSQITELEEQIEEMSAWKDKYENLRNQATAMKDKYEDRINYLESERDTLEEERNEALERANKQQEVKAPSGGDSSNQSVVGEVKKIMNSVYQELKSKFDADDSYSGADVLTAILNSIKSTTLKLVQSQGKKEQVQEESEEESDEEVQEQESEEEEEDEAEESVEEEEQEETIKPSKPEEGTSSVTQPNVKPANEILENVPHDLPEVTNETENDNVENVQSEASIVPSAENTPESMHDNSSENVVKKEQIKESVVNEEEEEEESSQGNEQVTNQIEEENENSQVDEQMTNQIKEEDIKVTSDLNTNTNESESKNNVKVEKENSDNEGDSSKKSNSKLDLSDFDIPKIEEKSQTNTVPPSVVSMEPPPLFDDDEKSEEKDPLNSDSLFGEDSHVEDTLGISFKKDETKDKKNKLTKVYLLDDDMKPQPPPPLFGDDDDDDELDWLN